MANKQNNLWSNDFFNSEWNKGYNGVNFQPNFSNTFTNQTRTDFASQFSRNTNKIINDSKFKIGMALNNSADLGMSTLGNQYLTESLNVDPLDVITTPSSNSSNSSTDFGNNYGQQALQFGLKAGKQIASQVGGKAGKVIGDTINLGGTIAEAAGAFGKGSLFNIGSTASAGLKNVGTGASIAGAAFDLLGNFLPDKQEYSGPKGDITSTIDQSYDALSNLAFAFGPIGAIVGGGMKGLSFIGKGLNALGGGTDAMTTQDAILGSSLLNIPFGMINGFGGKRADTITKNQDAFTSVGNSYTGTQQLVDSAVEKSNKKYGLLSSGARHSANRLIDKANNQQDILSNIADITDDRRDIMNSMQGYNNIRRQRYLNGGYDQSAVHIGKKGMKFETVIEEYDPLEHYSYIPEEDEFVNSFKNGGIIEEYDPLENQRSLEELIEYAKKQNPRFIQRLNEPVKYITDENGDKMSHRLSYVEIDNNAIVFPEVFEDKKGNLIYDKENAIKHALDNKDYLIMSPQEAEVFSNNGYKQGWPLFFNFFKFKEGGSFNVIPEGALHARLHHMENDENITKKGIPVISENEYGQIQQQAEIEKEEIIFRISVTKKLEQLAKEGTDEAAIEAGKLLVDEIFNNTIDNTNKLI